MPSPPPCHRMLLALLLMLLTVPTHADDWPHWRGPQRSDISREHSGWQGKDWPGGKLWQKNIGEGSGSPLVVAGRLYALGWQKDTDTVYCLDAITGKELWKQAYRCPAYGRKATGDESMYRGPSATPELDAATAYLYTLSTDGDLHCWDTKKHGQKVWGFNLHERYHIQQRPRVGRSGLRDYGCTGSPLVQGDWLLVEVGAKEGTVMAFDKRTGEQRWQSALRDAAGHSGGLVPMTVEGISCVAVFTQAHLAVLRLDKGHEGQTVAAYPWVTNFSNSIATPAVQDNVVLITASYNHGTICKLKITLQGAERVWEKPRASGVCSPIIHKGHVYWAWNRVHCLDFATGAEKWNGGQIGAAGSCIMTADDRLIVWCSRGTLLLVESAEHSPKAYRVLAERKILNDIAWPHIVLAAGRLYCKDRGGNLVCLEVQDQ